jgi:serine/threonine protein kinase
MFSIPVNYVIPKDAFVRSKDMLGTGTLSTTYKGEYQNKPVAIKVFKLRYLPPHLCSEFAPYIQVSHPNILKFHGIDDRIGYFAIITEIGYINLHDYIKTSPIPLPEVAHITKGILTGVKHLHSIGFGHKHLKSKNVFIMDNLEVKIGDFGLSKLKVETSTMTPDTTCTPTIRWRAPETFTQEYGKNKDSLEVQMPADMYSVGLLIWELFSKKIPFANFEEHKVIELKNFEMHEEIDRRWPSFYRELISNLWRDNAKSRMSAEEVLLRFEVAEKLVPIKLASECNDHNDFSQNGMPDILRYNIFPLMLKLKNKD